MANRAVSLFRPKPARLMDLTSQLEAIYSTEWFSNNGPTNAAFEQALVAELFAGVGGCVTMCNATIGLILALVQATAGRQKARRYALMPSFTFAATAHAAIWAGLTPLLCDIDPEMWVPCADSEQRLLERHGEQVAAIVPCATFGNLLDLERYRRLASHYGCALVVDAAASLGSMEMDGTHFGRGASEPIIFSMHATKAFATLEGGVVYSRDAARIADLRTMANFGFAERSAILPGLNAKLDEITALLALAKLKNFASVSSHRHTWQQVYQELLPEVKFQRMSCLAHAPTIVSVLLPDHLADSRALVRAAMLRRGVQTGTYYAPHLAQQPYFIPKCNFGALSVSDDVARRIVTLPMYDDLTYDDVSYVAREFRAACGTAARMGRVSSRSDVAAP